MHQPKHLDLFTGIGSFSLGARWSGYQTIAHSEIEPFCNELLTARFPSVPNVGDIRKLCRTTADCLTAREMPDHFDPATVDVEFDPAADPGCFCTICSEAAGYPVQGRKEFCTTCKIVLAVGDTMCQSLPVASERHNPKPTKTMNLYIYSTESNLHLYTIIGDDNAACEAKAEEMGVDGDSLASTYSPAFGMTDGLIENEDAEEIEA